MGTFEFYQYFFKKVTLAGLNSLRQKKCQYSTWYFMILPTFFLSKTSNICEIFHWIIKSKDSEELSGDFQGIRYLYSLIDLGSLSSLNGLSDLQSPFSSKNFLILMISSPLAPKLPKLVPFCGLDHKKSWFLLVSGNLDVRGCWGQPMLLFWKNIDKTQMSPSPKCAATFFWFWKSFSVGHLGLQSMSYQVETPCKIKIVDL